MFLLDLFVGRRGQFGTILFLSIVACLYLWFPDLEDEFGTLLAKIIVIMIMIVSVVTYKLFIAEDYIFADQRYMRRPWEMGSYPNQNGQTAGMLWSPAGQVIKRMTKREGIIVDRFTYMPKVKNRLFLLSVFKKWLIEKDLIITPKEFTRGSLIVGQMGAGKTEFLFSIVAQNRQFKYFNRMIFHDIKGDIAEKFYRKGKDIILNPFDKRGAVWDFFEEKSFGAIEIFFNAYMAAVQGKTKDFFVGSAKDRFMGLIMDIFFLKKSSMQKWDMFITALDNYITEVEKMERGSEKDIAQTLKLQIEFFRLQHWLLKQSGTKTFTISKYFANSGQSIFLLNHTEYAETLTPFFSGFIAAFTAILSSKQESQNDFTLLAIDEYLSFIEVLPDTTIKQLHTLIRSRGGCLMAFIQYLPERSGDKNLHQALMNSAAWLFAFETTDNYTLRQIKENIGKATYQKINKSAGTYRGSSGHSARGNESRSTEKVDLLDDDALADMNYHHITYSKANRLLYRGYTKSAKLKTISKQFIPRSDFDKFYQR